jgi:hypothetical protein
VLVRPSGRGRSGDDKTFGGGESKIKSVQNLSFLLVWVEGTIKWNIYVDMGGYLRAEFDVKIV